jgi:Kef-type K+ transport system membrane component KefB
MDFIVLLIIILVAALVGRNLSKRIKQPIILGEIIIGALIGNAYYFYTNEKIVLDVTIELLAEIGILFLLFSAGLSLNLKEFKKIESKSIIVAIFGVVLPFILGYLTSIYFGLGYLEALFIGTSMTATSIGVNAEILIELKIMGTRLGSLIIGTAVVDDIIAMIVLTILISIVKTGSLMLWDIGVFIALILAFLIIAMLLTKEKISNSLDFLLEKIKIRRENLFLIGTVVALFFSFIAESIGLSLIIGAFIAGIILGQLNFFRSLQDYVSFVGGGFFIPIFFVTVGMSFYFNAFLEIGLFAFVLLIVAILGKLIGCGIAARLSGFDNRDSLATGVAMIPRAGIELVLIKLGREYGIIGDEIVAAIVLMVIVTTLITPTALIKVLKK